jgi:hypothetical protein
LKTQKFIHQFRPQITQLSVSKSDKKISVKLNLQKTQKTAYSSEKSHMHAVADAADNGQMQKKSRVQD